MNYTEFKSINSVALSHANCSVDISDGSERGEYVSQEYILNQLGRPHRAVNLMYCYYPYDSGWPLRASKAYPEHKSECCWDYPYDDYFPYEGGLNGNPDAEVFQQMREIRQYGQDIILTLTIDPNVTDEHLKAIAMDLKYYGRLFLRVNHEATGNWFSFNKRCSYQKVADFYVHFYRIIKDFSPNVSLILCTGGIENPEDNFIAKETEFAEAVKITDIWSVDRYISLHWGWNFDIAEDNSASWFCENEEFTYDCVEKSFKRFCEINNNLRKPMFISEFNTDGDVNGACGQATSVERFYSMIEKNNAYWLNGICFYQFRDRGRLGLEIQSSSDTITGLPQPVMKTYKNIINRSWFTPKLTIMNEISLPFRARWYSSENAEGISLSFELNTMPVFCELYFDENDNTNCMIEFMGRWFRKAPDIKYTDLMPAVFENDNIRYGSHKINIFYPPPDGKNTDDIYCYCTDVLYIPKLRLKYNSIKR